MRGVLLSRHGISPGRLWSVPNLLSVSRIGLAAAIWIAPGAPALLLGAAGAAAVTDVLDGWVARRQRRAAVQRRDGGRALSDDGIGTWLDPLCDKIFVVSLLMAVWVTREPPIVILLLLATREIIQIPLLIAYGSFPALRAQAQQELRAAVVGKANTVAQFVTIAAIILETPFIMPLVVLTAVSGVVAGGHYVGRALLAVRRAQV